VGEKGEKLSFVDEGEKKESDWGDGLNVKYVVFSG